MKREVAALRTLGLTEYGARAYAALVSLGPSEAALVSQAASVPRTKVYQVLGELVKREWAQVEEGRPRRYRAVRPQVCFDRERERIDALLEDALRSLEAQYEERSTRFAGALWLLEGGEALAQKSLQMVESARREVALIASFPLPDDAQLGRALSRAMRRGVRVRLAARDPSAPEIAPLLRAGVEVRVVAVPPRVLYVDNAQALLVMPPRPGAQPRGVWNPSPELVSLMGPVVTDLMGAGEPPAEITTPSRPPAKPRSRRGSRQPSSSGGS